MARELVARGHGVVTPDLPVDDDAAGAMKSFLAGSAYTSIAFAKTLVLEGIAASIGSIGDAHDNALAETTIGLSKTETLSPASPFHCRPDEAGRQTW